VNDFCAVLICINDFEDFHESVTPASDGKSSMDASTEDGEEAHDDASDDEPSDEDTTSSST